MGLSVLQMLKSIWKSNYTIDRILMHFEIKEHCQLSGVVLDLGAGKSPSYYPFCRFNSGSRIIRVDLFKESAPNVICDMERGLPFKDSATDSILLFNILEHIYNPQHLLNEVSRVLKEEGTVYLFVPFLVGVHNDPYDYFRYTESALRTMFSAAGFKQIGIKPLGGYYTSMSVGCSLLKFRYVQLMFLTATILLDRLIDKLLGGDSSGRYAKSNPLGYFAIAQKGDLERV